MRIRLLRRNKTNTGSQGVAPTAEQQDDYNRNDRKTGKKNHQAQGGQKRIGKRRRTRDEEAGQRTQWGVALIPSAPQAMFPRSGFPKWSNFP